MRKLPVASVESSIQALQLQPQIENRRLHLVSNMPASKRLLEVFCGRGARGRQLVRLELQCELLPCHDGEFFE